MADDVQLTDLEVIQRYSLAVRAATAPREELMASLQADLDWLRDGRRPPAVKAVRGEAVRGEVAPASRTKTALKAAPAAPTKTAPKAVPAKAAPARATPTKAARVARAAKAPVKRSPRA